jgi:hypothetical protein
MLPSEVIRLVPTSPKVWFWTSDHDIYANEWVLGYAEYFQL